MPTESTLEGKAFHIIPFSNDLNAKHPEHFPSPDSAGFYSTIIMQNSTFPVQNAIVIVLNSHPANVSSHVLTCYIFSSLFNIISTYCKYMHNLY